MSIPQSSNEASSIVHPLHPHGSELTRQLMAWLQHDQALTEEEARAVSDSVAPQISAQAPTVESSKGSSVWESIKKVARFELLKQQKKMNQNFGLTQTSFEQLVRNLQAGDDQLFERIFLKHFDECVKFIVRQYRASWEDAYDASMECMVEFHRRLREGKINYGNLRFLFTRMAGQIYLKWVKKDNVKDKIEDGFDIAEQPEKLDPELMEVLNLAWGKMCTDCQGVLKAFYYDGMPLKELAEKLQKTPAAVRKQKQRCLDKLRNFFHNTQ